jgi:hypothetical protein
LAKTSHAVMQIVLISESNGRTFQRQTSVSV